MQIIFIFAIVSSPFIFKDFLPGMLYKSSTLQKAHSPGSSAPHYSMLLSASKIQSVELEFGYWRNSFSNKRKYTPSLSGWRIRFQFRGDHPPTRLVSFEKRRAIETGGGTAWLTSLRSSWWTSEIRLGRSLFYIFNKKSPDYKELAQRNTWHFNFILI